MISIITVRRLVTCVVALALAVLSATVLCAQQLAHASGTHDMHRLYNPNSGEHFYTADTAERDHLVSQGWSYEGIGWTAPENSETPVYRLYNANAGDHHYTSDKIEKDALISAGWRYEGVGWYSDDDHGAPLYRQYNPNAISGSHNYTTSSEENEWLVLMGWRAEGIGWYGVTESTGSSSAPSGTSSPNADKADAVAPKYSYDAYFVDSAGSQTIADTSKIVFIKTDNPDPSTIDVSQTKLCIKSSPLSYDLLDVNFTGNDSSRLKSVEGGYLASVCYFAPGENSIFIKENVDDKWVSAGKWTVQVEDDEAAEEAWCRQVIAEATDEGMDSYEKLDAVAEWLFSHFTYLANIDGKHVYLARTPDCYFQSYSWDSYTSPKVLAHIAEMIGGFDEVTNMYNQYQRGTADWQRMHHYVRVVYKGVTHYVSACPYASSGVLRASDIKKIDFSDMSGLVPLPRG